MGFRSLATVVLLVSIPAWGETVEALGQKLSFRNPSGYCTLGNTPRERELIDRSQRAVAPSTRILHAAIRCPELEAFKKGEREQLDHWLQVQLIGPKGEYRRFEMGREAFLAGMAKTAPKLDTAELQRRIKSAMGEGVGMTNMAVTPIGRDGNAVYFSVGSVLQVGGTTRKLTGLGAMTLVNALPLSMFVYEGTGKPASREALQPTLQQILLSLLTEN